MVIEVNGVSKTFKNQKVLDNISLSFRSGTNYGIVGRNGCGKTMLLRAICGFLKIDSGTVTQDGTEIGTYRNTFIKDSGVMIGENNFPGYLTGYENLKMLNEISRKLTDEELDEVLDHVGLSNARDKKYRKYSMGMKQRLKIAQAIMEKPGLLVLDEPFNGLDKDGVRDIKNIIKNEMGKDKLLILTSHNEQDINDLCDVIIEMDKGSVSDVIQREE